MDVPVCIGNTFPYISKAINAQSDEAEVCPMLGFQEAIQKQMNPHLVPCSAHGVFRPYLFFLSPLPLSLLPLIFGSIVLAFALSLLAIPVL